MEQTNTFVCVLQGGITQKYPHGLPKQLCCKSPEVIVPKLELYCSTYEPLLKHRNAVMVKPYEKKIISTSGHYKNRQSTRGILYWFQVLWNSHSSWALLHLQLLRSWGEQLVRAWTSVKCLPGCLPVKQPIHTCILSMTCKHQPSTTDGLGNMLHLSLDREFSFCHVLKYVYKEL